MDFKLYTNALKAYTSENGDLYVRGTTSSTIRDLHGDEMTIGALRSMEETAKQNMTVFLNHNYNVPDDLFGSVTDARIVKRYDSDLGAEVYDLDIDVRVVGEDENPLAMKTYRAIKRGVKLGLSIGAKVDKVSKKKGDGGEDTYIIEGVKLLETSVVGIPANQRSYLQNAIKSLRLADGSPYREDADVINFENAAPDSVKEGDFVSWGSSGGTARGRVEHVMREGTLGVPDSDFKINATPEDPAALIRIWSKGGDGWNETDKLVGHKFSTLRKIDSLKSFDGLVVETVEVEGQPAPESADAPEVPGEMPEVAEPVEAMKSAEADKETVIVEDLEQKKTRVTVTVSTEGDAAAPIAAPVAVEPEVEEEAVDSVEKAFEPTPAPAPAPTPAPTPEPAPEPAGEPKAPVADEDKSPRYKSGVSDQVLDGINSILTDLSEEDRVAVLAGLGVQKDGEPEAEAPISESDAVVEIAEDVVAEVAAEVAVEAPEVVAEAEPAEDVTASLEEVAAIAKSALDAAIAAQQEVASFKKELTELSEHKAKVEGELAKALDLVGRLINVPMGRKQAVTNTEKSTNGEKAPWLDPFIARLLDAQE